NVDQRVLQGGLAQLGIPRGDGRGHRHAPDLLLGQGAGLQDRVEIEPQVLGGLGDGGPESLQGVHQAAFIFSVSVSSPCFQLQGQSSSVWSASRTRSTSGTFRPTLRSLTLAQRMMPWGSTMNVARSGTPSALWRMPSWVDSSRLVSASIGNGRFRRSGWSFRQARCT